MSVVAWMLGALFLAATACLAFGSRNGATSMIFQCARWQGQLKGSALASDLTGWLIYWQFRRQHQRSDKCAPCNGDGDGEQWPARS